jgi:hypothetical protein
MKTGQLGRYTVNPDVRLVSVECFEHGANSALYYGEINSISFLAKPVKCVTDLRNVIPPEELAEIEQMWSEETQKKNDKN